MVFIDNRLHNLLTLISAFGAGSNKAVRIYEQLLKGGILDMPIKTVAGNVDIDEKSRERIINVSADDVGRIYEVCQKEDICILPIYGKDYPECLRNIPAPPLMLFVKGNLPDFDNEPVFCIVGPRRITDFGKKAAFSLARRISKAGMITVSGTACGADTEVHRGALDAGGISVMVSADGIMTELNSSNRLLCRKILERGCIISECPPYAKAYKYSFPIRNRIMSGLSLGVAVVEAPEKSGALITAGHALEQGRDVFVVPGNPANKAYKGSNALLRDGAIPLLDTSDIFTRYIPDFPDKIDLGRAFAEDITKTANKKPDKKSLSGLSKEAVLVYNNLVKPEFTVDDLAHLDIDGGALLSALTELEFEHFIKPLPGGAYKISDK